MEKNWYVLNVVNGKEKKIKDNLEKIFLNSNLSKYIYNIVIPIEKIKVIKNGKPHIKEKSFLPGYIFIKCEMNGEIERTIKSISYIKKIVGNNNKPDTVSPQEMNDILKRIDDSTTIDETISNFIIGESVKILSGPFSNFDAIVQEILPDRNRIKVSVKIFGRDTIMDVDMEHIIKNY